MWIKHQVESGPDRLSSEIWAVKATSVDEWICWRLYSLAYSGLLKAIVGIFPNQPVKWRVFFMAHTETQHDLTIFKVHLCGGKPLKNPQSQGCSGSLMVADFVDPRLVYPASGQPGFWNTAQFGGKQVITCTWMGFHKGKMKHVQ